MIVVGSPWSTEAVSNALCDRCGTSTVASGAQTIRGDRLEWSWSVRCPHCGDEVVMCGSDKTPDRVRAAIVAREGLSVLRGDPSVNRSQRVAILAVFRRNGMALAEATDAYDRLTGEGITGLPVELRLLAERLTDAGALVVTDTDAPH